MRLQDQRQSTLLLMEEHTAEFYNYFTPNLTHRGVMQSGTGRYCAHNELVP